MRKLIFLCLFMTIIAACKKETATVINNPEQIPAETLAKIEALGFNPADVHRFMGDYLVEGDIRLSEADLDGAYNGPILRVAGSEQYRTTNICTGLPKTYTVKVSNLGSAYIAGTDTAISRFNRLHISISFVRITSGTADITITGFNQGPSGGYITLGSSGFPTSDGKPYCCILLNTNSAAYGSNPNVLYIASVIQHELGHCIGFRHTDYFSRGSYGGTPVNEGGAGVGAIYIPGTPTTADLNSWMVACSNGGNRTFNTNDIIALNYLY